MDPIIAETVLATIRRSLGLSVGVVRYAPNGHPPEWRIDARDANMLLAKAVGFDLEE